MCRDYAKHGTFQHFRHNCETRFYQVTPEFDHFRTKVRLAVSNGIFSSLAENFFALLGASHLRGVSYRRVRSGERAYGRWLPTCRPTAAGGARRPRSRSRRAGCLGAVLRLPLRCGRSCVLALGPAGRCWPARIFAQRTRLVAPALGAAPSGADFFRQAKDSVATVSTLATWSPADVPRQHAIALRKSPELR